MTPIINREKIIEEGLLVGYNGLKVTIYFWDVSPGGLFNKSSTDNAFLNLPLKSIQCRQIDTGKEVYFATHIATYCIQ